MKYYKYFIIKFNLKKMTSTTCREAIKAWETSNQKKASEAVEIKIMCQFPPIDKMDDSLNTLEMCEYLSISNNSIERIISLPKLKNLKILSLGRNNIKRL